MRLSCPNCQYIGNRRGLSQHWRHRNSHKPLYSDKQMEILTGILMGDGSINHSDGNSPRMKIEMVNKEYLCWLSSVLSPLCGGVKEWDDTYCLYTARSDCLQSLQSWYESGEKVFGNLTLTPTVLKHWYVCDGNLEEQAEGCRIRLAIWNERERSDEIISLFSECGLPEPTIVTGDTYCNAQFTQEETRELFKYMGEPVHGFESKWSKRNL